MQNEERTDLLIAVAIGAALGIGATLLLRGGAADRNVRVVLRELEPLRRDVHRRMADARSELRGGSDRIARAGGAAAAATRGALDAFREEVADIVSEARDEIVRTARTAARDGQRALRRARRSR
jgi:hypothetical protein